MGSGFPIACAYGPAIIIGIHIFGTHIDHGFYGQYQVLFQFGACAAFAVIGHLRVFVQAAPQAMAYQLPYYTVSMLFFGTGYRQDIQRPQQCMVYGDLRSNGNWFYLPLHSFNI